MRSLFNQNVSVLFETIDKDFRRNILSTFKRDSGQNAESSSREQFPSVFSDGIMHNVIYSSAIVEKAIIDTSNVSYMFKEEYERKNSIDEYLSNEIKTINVSSMTVVDMKNLIYNLYKSLKGKLFGIVVEGTRDGFKYRYNILHPVIMKRFIDNESLFVGTKKIHIYTTKSHFSLDDIDKEDENYKKVVNLVINMMAISIDVDNYFIPRVIKNVKDNDAKEFILRERNYVWTSNNFADTLGKPIEYFYSLTPVDILTEGVAYPFYGCVISKRKASNSISRDLLPMMSCNVGSHNISKSDEWGNTCTGSLLNSTSIGIASLNRANLNSPYRRKIFNDYSILGAKACINTAIALLNKDIKEEEQENGK